MENRYAGYDQRGFPLSTPIFVGIVLACLGSWFFGYLFSIGFPVYGEVGATPLWNVFCQALTRKETAYLIGVSLMTGGAFFLQKANYELNLVRGRNFLPFFMNIFLISTNPDFFPINSASFGVFFLVVALYLLFTSYHNPNARSAAFNASFAISLGSLLWIHILWFIPLFWHGMYRFRALTIRTFFASVLGIATVYWFLLGWSVWTKDFSPFEVFPSLFKVQLHSFSQMDWPIRIGTGWYILLLLLSISTIILNDIQRTRQYMYYLLLFAVWAFVLAFLFSQSINEFLQAACIPSSILVARFFLLSQRRIVRWLFYFSLILFVFLLVLRLWSFL